ncbi:MAG: hypothetical protein OXN21_14540, partial [Chloroflexota bacterium]|nr:hypothetical protein [Chloroflexota bacterium]
MATWIVRGGDKTHAVNDFLRQQSVGVDYYTGTEDLTDSSKNQIRTLIVDHYPKKYHAPSISSFCN